jgi:hypothetical protein
MKKKISLLLLTTLLTIIIFSVSTYLQRKLINYEPTISCFIALKDIIQYQKIDIKDVKKVEVPISLVINTKIIKEYGEIDNLYTKDKIYAGQLIIKDQLDTSDNLRIYEFDPGKEITSIKVKSPENAASFQLRKNANINLYITLRYDLGEKFLLDKERVSIGTIDDGYVTIKLIENVKVLGLFDSLGNPIEGLLEREPIDSVLIAITNEEAEIINLIRDVGTFNITEVKNESISN